MCFIYQIFVSLFCLLASMATAIILQSNGNRASFINGRSIVIPHSLMTLEGGSHAVSLDGHEIIVQLLMDRGEIIPVFTVPVAFSVDKDLNKIPIVKLLTEVLTSSASKRQDVIVASGLSEGLRVEQFETCEGDEMVDWVTNKGICLASLPRTIIREQNLLHRGIGVLILDLHRNIYIHQRSSSKKVFPSMYDMFVGGVSSSGEAPYQTLIRELIEEVGLDFTSTPNNSAAVSVECSKNNGVNEEENSGKKKRPYADKIGKGNLFEDEEVFQKFMKNPSMSQKEKNTFLISQTVNKISSPCSDIRSGNKIKYLGLTTISTSYNNCIVDCYSAMCSEEFANSITFPDGEIDWGEWVTLDALNTMLEQKEIEFVPDGLQVWRALPHLINQL